MPWTCCARAGGSSWPASRAGSWTESRSTRSSPERVTIIGATSQSTDANAAAAKLVAAAAVPLHKMRTHVVGYDELPYAIDLLTNKVPGEKAINVVVTPTTGADTDGSAPPRRLAPTTRSRSDVVRRPSWCCLLLRG